MVQLAVDLDEEPILVEAQSICNLLPLNHLLLVVTLPLSAQDELPRNEVVEIKDNSCPCFETLQIQFILYHVVSPGVQDEDAVQP